MKLTVLSENIAGSKFLAEHGLSYLIECNGERIMFDTGSSDVFIKNAELLGIDIEKDIEKIVLSHGHWDHGDGLRFLANKTLITHPGSFKKRFGKSSQTFIGLALSREEIISKFNLVESKKPFEISKNIKRDLWG